MYVPETENLEGIAQMTDEELNELRIFAMEAVTTLFNEEKIAALKMIKGWATTAIERLTKNEYKGSIFTQEFLNTPVVRKCIVLGCENRDDEGEFHGYICDSCYAMLLCNDVKKILKESKRPERIVAFPKYDVGQKLYFSYFHGLAESYCIESAKVLSVAICYDANRCPVIRYNLEMGPIPFPSQREKWRCMRPQRNAWSTRILRKLKESVPLWCVPRFTGKRDEKWRDYLGGWPGKSISWRRQI